MDNVEAILSVATTAVNAAKRAEERVEALRQITLFNGGGNDDKSDEEEDDDDGSTTSSTYDAAATSSSWIDRIFDGVIPMLSKLIQMMLWGTGLLMTSACIYALFYFMVMPSLIVQQDVYFDYMHTFDERATTATGASPAGSKMYSTTSNGEYIHGYDNSRNANEGDMQSTSCNNVDAKDDEQAACLPSSTSNDEAKFNRDEENKEQSSGRRPPLDEEPPPNNIMNQNNVLSPWPTAWVDLFSSHSQWKAFDSDVIPDPWIHDKASIPTTMMSRNGRGGGRLLHAPSRYWMDVNLILPESVSNVNLGIFMMQMELFDSSKQLLAISKRPVLFPYSSGFIRHVRKVFGLIPLALGAIPEARTVTVSGFDQYVESKQRPLRYVRITLLLPPTSTTTTTTGAGVYTSSYQQSNLRQVQVFGAELHIGKELSRLQYCMKIWFFTTTTLGVCACFVLQLFILLIVKVIWNNREKLEPSYLTEGHNNDQQRHDVDDDAVSTSASQIFASHVVEENINDNDNNRRRPSMAASRDHRRQSTTATGRQSQRRRKSKQIRRPSSSNHQHSHRRRRSHRIPSVCLREQDPSPLQSTTSLQGGRRYVSKAVIPDSVAITRREAGREEDEQYEYNQQQPQRLLDRDHDDVIDLNEAISYGSSTGPMNEDDNDEFWENLSQGAITVGSTTRDGEEEERNDEFADELRGRNGSRNNMNNMSPIATPISITPNHLEPPSLD